VSASGNGSQYFQVEDKPGLLPKTERAIGIDVGIRHFLTDSERRQVENPRFYERTLEQIRREAVKEEERLEEQGEGQSKARQSIRETGEPAKRLPPQTLKVLHKRPDRRGAPEHLPSERKDSRYLLG